MAALDLTSAFPLPRVYNVTLGTAGNVRTVILPTVHDDMDVSFFPRATAAKFLDGQHGLVEDAAIGSTAYATLPADAWTTVRVGREARAGMTIALASATGSQVMEIRIARATGLR